MTKHLISTLILLMFLCTGNLFAQPLWKTVKEDKIPAPGTRYIIPDAYKTYALDEAEVKIALRNAPLEETAEAETEPAYFTMPMPDGTFRNFQIVNSPVMAAGLGRKFPEIQTYAGYDIDNPANTVRFDLTPHGFHAMVFTQKFGTVYIDPYSFHKKGFYIVYSKKDFRPIAGKKFVCDVVGNPVDVTDFDSFRMAGTPFGDCTKRTYRLAVAATGEYTAFHGGTQALAIAAQVTTMNRVNGVYMREMAIFMEIVPNNDLIVYDNANTDPYSNGNTNSMYNEVQVDCDTNIGTENYDIGHVFGTDSGGLAGLGVICTEGSKARGVTGSGAPVGDPFDIDYVAHEMGHQFGCNHTQNNNCNSNGSTSMEPGSASTIMGYAGICAPNVQSNSDDHFHGVSLKEMSNRILSTSCAQLTSLANTTPVINSVTTGITIPGGTAFALTADVTDAEGDMLTYCWEQMDPEASTQPPVSTSTDGPNFRSNSPVADPTRYFPNLTDYLAGVNPTWEVLATVTRVFNFRVSVRDNSPAGGCTTYEDAVVNVDGNSGPFLVQNPSDAGISWEVGSTQSISWDVAGTDAAPVSCANVDILLSVDGGFTYPVVLATNVPNDGLQDALVPNNVTTTARVKIVCSDNIFYDISDNDFAIVSTVPDFTLTASPALNAACDSEGMTYAIDVISLLGYTDDVVLSVAGLPAGVSGVFDVNPVTPGGIATLTLAGSAAPGVYSFEVSGTSTTGVKTLPLAFEVFEPAPATVILTSPADGTVDVSTSLALSWEVSAGTDVTYQLEVATDPGFTTLVVNEASLSENSYPVSGLMINSYYYWRVKATNSCGEGMFSPTFSFRTAVCQTFTSVDIPITISPMGKPKISSTLDVAGLTAILDVNIVLLQGTHSWINDLTFDIDSPAGTSVNLWTNICGGEENFDIQLDDAAASATLPCPPTGGGTYQPAGSLAAFNGEDPNGTWTLRVADSYNQDGGSLNAWAIEICTAAPPQPFTLTCPVDVVEFACQDQLAIDAAFDSWLNSATATGDCSITISNDAMGAPNVCAGGTAVVNFTATGACGTATCSATFTVVAPDPLTVACPADQLEITGQTQAEVDAAFATWLGGVTVSGGCNATISNDNTGAPDVATGGTTTVTFTALDDCLMETCMASFTVESPVEPPCLVDDEISATHTAGNILVEVANTIISTETVTGTANVEYSAGVSIELNAGFTVDAGAVFHAYILGCQTPAAVGTTEEKKDKK